MKEKQVKVQAYIYSDTKEAILKMAKEENRSESNIINILLLEAIIERTKINK
jgi:hypothetical protein